MPLPALEYVPITIFEHMANCRNLYAIQGKIFKNTTHSKIEVLISSHIVIGCFNKFPRVRTTIIVKIFLEYIVFWKYDKG